MSAIVTRKINCDHRYGGYYITLPIEWVRYIEKKYNQTLYAVSIEEQNGNMLITAVKTFDDAYHYEGQFRTPCLNEKLPLMGLKEVNRWQYIPWLKNKHGIDILFNKVYRVGKHSLVVALHKWILGAWELKAKKWPYYVDILIRDETLLVTPKFLNLPDSRWQTRSLRTPSPPIAVANQPVSSAEEPPPPAEEKINSLD